MSWELLSVQETLRGEPVPPEPLRQLLINSHRSSEIMDCVFQAGFQGDMKWLSQIPSEGKCPGLCGWFSAIPAGRHRCCCHGDNATSQATTLGSSRDKMRQRGRGTLQLRVWEAHCIW